MSDRTIPDSGSGPVSLGDEERVKETCWRR